jgi:hypothetical protein
VRDVSIQCTCRSMMLSTSFSSADMPAVGADDSGEHERDYRRSGRGRKRSSLAQQAMRWASSRVSSFAAERRP